MLVEGLTVIGMTADVSTLPNLEIRELNAEIRSLMGRYDVNQTMLAEFLGMTQVSVSERLRGVTDWKAPELLEVARAFGRHVSELFGGHGPHGRGPDGVGADDETRTRNILLGMRKDATVHDLRRVA